MSQNQFRSNTASNAIVNVAGLKFLNGSIVSGAQILSLNRPGLPTLILSDLSSGCLSIGNYVQPCRSGDTM